VAAEHTEHGLGRGETPRDAQEARRVDDRDVEALPPPADVDAGPGPLGGAWPRQSLQTRASARGSAQAPSGVRRSAASTTWRASQAGERISNAASTNPSFPGS